MLRASEPYWNESYGNSCWVSKSVCEFDQKDYSILKFASLWGVPILKESKKRLRATHGQDGQEAPAPRPQLLGVCHSPSLFRILPHTFKYIYFLKYVHFKSTNECLRLFGIHWGPFIFHQLSWQRLRRFQRPARMMVLAMLHRYLPLGV